jgi:hypothetical protein
MLRWATLRAELRWSPAVLAVSVRQPSGQSRAPFITARGLCHDALAPHGIFAANEKREP